MKGDEARKEEMNIASYAKCFMYYCRRNNYEYEVLGFMEAKEKKNKTA